MTSKTFIAALVCAAVLTACGSTPAPEPQFYAPAKPVDMSGAWEVDHARSDNIQKHDLLEIASCYDNETEPKVLDSGERLVRLEGTLVEGTLENQYSQWRSILSRLIQLERGLP